MQDCRIAELQEGKTERTKTRSILPSCNPAILQFLQSYNSRNDLDALNGVDGHGVAFGRKTGIRLAEHLLQRDGSMTPRRTRYLVMLAMLGHIAQNDKPAAGRLWSLYGSKIPPDPDSQMLFRILAAHSAEP